MGHMRSESLILAILVLLVCIFFLFYGGGKHSADYYFKMQQ
jgi:cbb3-type cytochrome oxidase subunit 3